uniref:Uncharacterized protein n=1 Tax=Opuntia streptacantha TaxID=393608 RepID=A0A7C9FGD3_OPUST
MTNCHLYTKSVALNLLTLKTVTFSGTGTRLRVYDTMTAKLAPPPPRMAQNRSSPMVVRFRTLPWASTTTASITWSTDRPCLRIMFPYPPPLMWPPAPTVGHTPAGNPSVVDFSWIR